MLNLVEGRIYFCIFDCLSNHFHANYFFGKLAYKYANATCTTVKIIYYFVSGKTSEIPSDGIQFFSLQGIGLKKGFRTDLKGKFFQLFNYKSFAMVHDRTKVVDGIVPFGVDRVE